MSLTGVLEYYINCVISYLYVVLFVYLPTHLPINIGLLAQGMERSSLHNSEVIDVGPPCRGVAFEVGGVAEQGSLTFC